ncbi:MAG: OmpA family protein [Candidatus Electrothrix sp. AR4]|nr:OmpA family protein [Candidatus Electrothrix sp. AR4]
MNKKICIFLSIHFFFLTLACADEIQEYSRQQEMASCIVQDNCNISDRKNEIKECMRLPDNEEFEDYIIVIGNPCSVDKKTMESTTEIISKLLHSIKKLPVDTDFDLNLFTDIQVTVIYVPIKTNIHVKNKAVETQKAPGKSKNIPVIMARFKKDIFFDFNSSQLKNPGYVIIQNFVHDVLARSTEYKIITVIGHADNIGTEKANFILSKQRSDVTAAEIQKQIDKTGAIGNLFLIESIGAGETQPTAHFAQETKSDVNRRVELFLSTSSSAMHKAKKYIQCLYKNKQAPVHCFNEYLVSPVQ